MGIETTNNSSSLAFALSVSCWRRDGLCGWMLPIKHADSVTRIGELKRARFALQNVVPVAGLRFILRECRLK
jgi:hypothetical protein